MPTHHSNQSAAFTNQAGQSHHEAKMQELEAALQAERARHSAIMEELQLAKGFSEKIVDTVRESLVILTPKYVVHQANASFYTHFRVTPEETIGHSIYQLGNQQWDIPALHTLLEAVLPNNQVFNDYEITHKFEQIGQRTMLLNARRLDHVQFILLAIEDITERKQAETALHLLNATLEEHNATLEEQVAQRTAQVRAMASTLTLAEQKERRRIAQILHDDLQQQLYGIQMRLLSIQQDVAPDSTLATEMQEAATWLGQAIQVSRQLTVDLSPPILKAEGLTEALEWLATRMTATHGVQIAVQAAHSFQLANEDIRVLLIQLVRELLFNVVKHAQTNQATVEVTEDDDNTLRVVVQDRGCGFDVPTAEANAHGGFGLFSIRERLALFAGHMHITSAPGQGTRITLTVPAIVAPASE